MKKVLIISSQANALQEMNKTLEANFQTNVTEADDAKIKGFIRILKPDVIVLHYNILIEINDNLFAWIEENYNNIKILVIGKVMEYNRLKNSFPNLKLGYVSEEVESGLLLAMCFRAAEITDDKASVEDILNQRKTILLVDDNPIVLRNIKSMLDDRYRVMLANSGENAIKCVMQNKIDLVLLDYEMPDMDGKEVLDTMQKMEECVDIPVVFLTSVSDRRKICAVLLSNPAGYVLKPPDKNKLIEIIERHVRK